MKRESLPICLSAAKCLQEHKERIAAEASERTYREIRGYKDGNLPQEESRRSILSLLDFIIKNLKKPEEVLHEEGFFVQNLIKFEEGIASRRVHYQIDLVDLLHGIRICRNKVWETLRNAFRNRNIHGSEFFEMERRINTLVVYFFIGISDKYLLSKDEVIESQELALEKWEEVVKSASRIDLKIPCRGEFALIVRSQAEAIARRLRYTEDEVQDIKVAVGEACDNSIEHGVSDRGIDIYYTISMEELRITIFDYGRGFDPQGKGESLPELLCERGRGIYLMKRLMDRVEINSKPGGGTQIVLAKKRYLR